VRKKLCRDEILESSRDHKKKSNHPSDVCNLKTHIYLASLYRKESKELTRVDRVVDDIEDLLRNKYPLFVGSVNSNLSEGVSVTGALEWLIRHIVSV